MEHLGGFFQRAAAKGANFDQLGKTLVELFQPPDHVVQEKNRDLVWCRDVQAFVNRHELDAVAPFVRIVPARVIHEEPPHHLTRHAIEMCAVSPVDTSLIDQFQVGLMDQCGGLECMVRAFPLQLARGNAAQLGVDERRQSIERVPIAPGPGLEERGDLRGAKASSDGRRPQGYANFVDPREPLLCAI